MLFNATTFNLHQEAARAYLRGKHGAVGESGNPLKPHPFNTAWFKFDESSLGLPPFSVVKIGAMVGAVTDALKLTTLGSPIFVAETPATADDQFAVVVNGIPAGDAFLGLGAVAGVVLCKVDVTDAGHARAKPTPGETGYLTSAASGGVPILWKESGTGEVWAVVRIDEGGESASDGDSDAACSGRAWWGGLRNTDICFRVYVKSAAGACACVDTTFDEVLGFDTSAWVNPDILLEVCLVDYAISLTKPAGVPTMTLTPSGTAGSTMTVAAVCYGDGWAEFSFPGDLEDVGACTDPEAAGCADNSFVIRVECQAPQWWCVVTGGVQSCVQSCLEPAGAVADPVATEAECEGLCSCEAWNPDWNGLNLWFCTSDSGHCFGTRACTQLNADPGSGVCICAGPFDTEAECEASCIGANSAACCPGELYPDVMYVTVSGHSGVHQCVCLNGTFPITWTATLPDNPVWGNGKPGWIGEVDWSGCPLAGNQRYFFVLPSGSCVGHLVKTDVSGNHLLTDAVTGSGFGSCNPFYESGGPRLNPDQLYPCTTNTGVFFEFHELPSLP